MIGLRVFRSVIAVGMLASCGGSGSSTSAVMTDPVRPTPAPEAPTSIATPVPSSTPITLSDVNANAEDLINTLTDIGERADLSGIPPLDSVADLQARGDAIYEGAFYVFGDAARVDGFVGNAVVAVGFDGGNTPTVNGSADGFIYVDGPELSGVVGNDLFEPLSSDVPIFEAQGRLDFTDGELANTAGVATAGFSIAGTLQADTGEGIETVTVDGAMAVLFDGDNAIGVGGNNNDPDFDLTSPEAFFFGTSVN